MVLKIILFLFISNLQAEVVKPKLVKLPIEKYFTFGYFSFQNKTKIKSPETANFDLNYNTSGLIFGYQEATDLKKIRISTNIDLFYGNTDARSDSFDLYYFKKQLPTFGILGGIATLIPLDAEKKYFLGPELNIYYVYTNWYIPTTTNGTWTIQNTAKITGSFLINGEYHYNKFEIYHKFGFPISGTSFVWNLGIGFKL